MKFSKPLIQPFSNWSRDHLANGIDQCDSSYWQSSRAKQHPTSTGEFELLVLYKAFYWICNRSCIIFELLLKEPSVVFYMSSQTLRHSSMKVTAATMPKMMFHLRKHSNDEIVNSICHIESTVISIDAITMKKPNLAVHLHMKTDVIEICFTRFCMFEYSIYRKSCFILKNTVFMTSDLNNTALSFSSSYSRYALAWAEEGWTY